MLLWSSCAECDGVFQEHELVFSKRTGGYLCEACRKKQLPAPELRESMITDQLWRGEFGTQYTARNRNKPIAPRIALLGKILERTRNVYNVLEVGAGSGHNIVSLQAVLPHFHRLGAIEINEDALVDLHKIPDLEVFTEFPPDTYDLVLTSGFLIHVAADHLPEVLGKIYRASRRYVCLIEYYSPRREVVKYRHQDNALWRDDFALMMMSQFELRLIDYGFVYRHDPVFPLGDVTWFLLEKV